MSTLIKRAVQQSYKFFNLDKRNFVSIYRLLNMYVPPSESTRMPMPTMCVKLNPKARYGISMHYHPAFVKGSFEHFEGSIQDTVSFLYLILIHETLHITFGHVTKEKLKLIDLVAGENASDKKKAKTAVLINIAEDWQINTWMANKIIPLMMRLNKPAVTVSAISRFLETGQFPSAEDYKKTGTEPEKNYDSIFWLRYMLEHRQDLVMDEKIVLPQAVIDHMEQQESEENGNEGNEEGFSVTVASGSKDGQGVSGGKESSPDTAKATSSSEDVISEKDLEKCKCIDPKNQIYEDENGKKFRAIRAGLAPSQNGAQVNGDNGEEDLTLSHSEGKSLAKKIVNLSKLVPIENVVRKVMQRTMLNAKKMSPKRYEITRGSSSKQGVVRQTVVEKSAVKQVIASIVRFYGEVPTYSREHPLVSAQTLKRVILPTFKRRKSVDATIFIDVSSSMRMQDLQMVYSSCYDLLKKLGNLSWVTCNSSIVERGDCSRGLDFTKELRIGGCTYFQEAFYTLAKEGKKVIFAYTDGQFSPMTIPKSLDFVVWLVVPKNQGYEDAFRAGQFPAKGKVVILKPKGGYNANIY